MGSICHVAAALRNGTFRLGRKFADGAYVVPMLRRRAERDIASVMLRAFGNIDLAVRRALGAEGCVWKKRNDLGETNARDCIEKAAKHATSTGRHLVVVIDQFEEVSPPVA
jgi:hypothetical protein